MNFEQTELEPLHITQDKLLAFVRDMIGVNNGREDDDHPLPPGPWDPVIRVALRQVDSFGPSPEPWRVFDSNSAPSRTIKSVFGPQPEPGKSCSQAFLRSTLKFMTPSAAATGSVRKSHSIRNPSPHATPFLWQLPEHS